MSTEVVKGGRGGARLGAGRKPLSDKSAAYRMRRTREGRRFLFGYRDKTGAYHEGLRDLRRYCIAALKEIIQDKESPHRVAAIRIYAERFAPARLEADVQVSENGKSLSDIMLEAMRRERAEQQAESGGIDSPPATVQ